MGELVDDVRTFYAQENKNKEMLKQLLHFEGSMENPGSVIWTQSIRSLS